MTTILVKEKIINLIRVKENSTTTTPIKILVKSVIMTENNMRRNHTRRRSKTTNQKIRRM